MPVLQPSPLVPSWITPENASVLDPWYRAPIRTLVSVLGLDDPTQIVGIGANALEEPAAGVAARFPRFMAAVEARAKAMGFRTNMPLYHGTASDIAAFDLAKGGRTSGSSVGAVGVSTGAESAGGRGIRESGGWIG